MCIDGGDCFLIDTGRGGPEQTQSGSANTHDAHGGSYQTYPGPGSTSYDHDAIATGLPANDTVGKWIHKTERCAPGGRNATLGCIAVPCNKWPEVKQQKGKRVFICGSQGVPSGGGDSASGNAPSPHASK